MRVRSTRRREPHLRRNAACSRRAVQIPIHYSRKQIAAFVISRRQRVCRVVCRLEGRLSVADSRPGSPASQSPVRQVLSSVDPRPGTRPQPLHHAISSARLLPPPPPLPPGCPVICPPVIFPHLAHLPPRDMARAWDWVHGWVTFIGLETGFCLLYTSDAADE